MSIGWVSTCLGRTPVCVGRWLASITSTLATEGAQDAWEVGVEAQVRHVSSLGSLPSAPPWKALEPRTVLTARAFPGTWQRMEPLPACPGTLQVHRVPGCGGVGGGKLADTPGDWGVGKVPTSQEESCSGQTFELSSRPAAVILTMAPPDHRGQQAWRRKEKPCGWVAGFMGLCCGFGWEGG